MSTGQIFIELSQGQYSPGDTVFGNIYLNINESYDSGKIKMKFKGWESVQWITMSRVHDTPENPFQPPDDDCLSGSDCNVSSTSTDSSDCKMKSKKGYFKNKRNEYYRVEHNVGGKEFAKLKIPLEQFQGGQINAGHYQIPFSFVLNSQWPGSFSHKVKKEKARIKYEIRVKCELDDGKEREFKHTTELLVVERMKDSIHAQEKDIKVDVKCCCCISRGVTNFKVQFEKNAYQLGEEANMICEIDNKECQAKVNYVEAELVYRIILSDKHNRKHSIKKVLASKRFEGVEAEKKVERRESMKMVNNVKSKKKVINPSVKGRHIESDYYLEVKCDMDACCNGCCNEVPEIKFPVMIFPQPFQQPQFVQPYGWNPQVYPTFNMPIPGSGPPMNPMGQQPMMQQQQPLQYQQIDMQVQQ